MIQFSMITLILINNFIFMSMNHPLAMGLMLMIQTILISLITGFMMKTFWFSYILFLIFLGGMLILFIYVTSLASNEMFNLSMKTIMYFFLFLIITNFIIIFLDKNIFNIFFMNYEITQFNNFSMFMKENTLELNKLYNYPSNMITILLINYLLITLIAVVKITKMFYGPLRSMN